MFGSTDDLSKPRDESNDPDALEDYSQAGGVQPLEGIQVQSVQASDPSTFHTIVAENQGAIRQVKNALAFRDVQKTQWSHGLRNGELDEGALHKLAQPNVDTIWSRKEKIKKPQVAVTILVDESGSMRSASHSSGELKCNSARRMAIILAEAIKDVPGVDLRVLGHTADIDIKQRGYDYDHIQGPVRSTGNKHHLVMREFVTAKMQDYTALGNITGIANNMDGYAMEYAAKDLAKEFPEAKRFVFHISDGQPAARIYRGKDSVEHMRGVVEKCSARKLAEIYAIGVDNAYSTQHGIDMYGPDRNVVIPDVDSSVNIITSFLRQVLSKV
jgi:cobalamin biosynthesis protein CobT